MRASADPDDDGGVVDLYVDGLRRSQLGLALIALVALVGLVIALPLVSLVVPALEAEAVGRVPVLVLLPLVPFPAFVLVGLLLRRRADELDRGYAVLEAEQRDRPGAGAPRG